MKGLKRYFMCLIWAVMAIGLIWLVGTGINALVSWNEPWGALILAFLAMSVILFFATKDDPNDIW